MTTTRARPSPRRRRRRPQPARLVTPPTASRSLRRRAAVGATRSRQPARPAASARISTTPRRPSTRSSRRSRTAAARCPRSRTISRRRRSATWPPSSPVPSLAGPASASAPMLMGSCPSPPSPPQPTARPSRFSGRTTPARACSCASRTAHSPRAPSTWGYRPSSTSSTRGGRPPAAASSSTSCSLSPTRRTELSSSAGPHAQRSRCSGWRSARSRPGSSTRTWRRPTGAGMRSGARRSTSTSATSSTRSPTPRPRPLPTRSTATHEPSSTTSTDAQSTSSRDGRCAARRSRSRCPHPGPQVRPSFSSRAWRPRRRSFPPDPGYLALERRVGAWVDGGLAHRSRAPWNLGLRLDEDGEPGASDGEAPPVVLELWLEAADDPTLALPASLLEDGADDVFGFLRDSDPRRSLERRLTTIEPILADAGIVLDGDAPTRVELDGDSVRAFLRDAMPRLEELDVPVRLPRAWVVSSSRVRVNLVATGTPGLSSGLLTRDAIASFDWRLAIGDVELTEDELRTLAAAKEPLVRLRGKWHALRASEVERALRFLDGRASGRGCRGARPRGLRAGDRRGGGRARRGQGRRRPRGAPRGHVGAPLPRAGNPGGADPRPVPVPGARPRLAPAAGRSGSRRDPGRRHGPRQDRAGDRDVRLRARGRRGRRRADARREPDERRAAMGAGDRPLRSRRSACISTTVRRGCATMRSSRRHSRATWS